MRPCGKRLFCALLLVPALPAGFWAVGKIGGNVHEVVAGRLYRSAQLTGSTLERTIAENRIASVLNLRGRHPGVDDYDDEMAVCRRAGVAHADVRMSATRLPTPDELKRLLSALDRLPRPILVHCRAGADRTGLAATLYESIYEGLPIDRAQALGLSWRYGHTGRGKAAAMDRFVDLYRRTRGGLDLRTWIGRTYPGVYREAAKS